MCDGEERRRKEVLHGEGGKPLASVGLSVYRKGKGNMRAVLPTGNKSALCYQRLLLFWWTSQLFLTDYPGIETAYGLLVRLILRAAEKRKLHKRSGFPQTSKSCFEK